MSTFDEWWSDPATAAKFNDGKYHSGRDVARAAYEDALELAARQVEKDESARFGWVVDHDAIAAWLRSLK